MTAAEKILSKALVGSKLDSAGWSQVQAGLRDRAFFSAKVEEARILAEARRMASEVADGSRSESEFRRDLRKVLDDMGVERGDGSITDLHSKARLDLIVETNVRQARGWAQWKEGTTAGALAAVPAQELVRVRDRKVPREWDQRWAAAGGRLYGGRKVALKNDPVWTKISSFGTPWPPYDFNSGMGVEDVDWDEAVELGLLKDDDPPPKMPERGFNDGLSAKIPVQDKDDENGLAWTNLKETFGDLIEVHKGEVTWVGNRVQENLLSGGTFNMRLGFASPQLQEMLSDTPGGKDIAKLLAGKHLHVDQTWRDSKRGDGTDHTAHFFPEPDKPDNSPLTPGDMDLLPSIWRKPDHVKKLQKEIFEADIEGLDGSRFVIQVRIAPDENNGDPRLWTFYRTKAPRKLNPRGIDPD